MAICGDALAGGNVAEAYLSSKGFAFSSELG